MNFTIEQIALLLGGEVVGNKELQIHSLGKIESATQGDLTFLANPKYEHFIYSTEASVVLVNRDFVPKDHIKSTLIKVDNAYLALSKLLAEVDKLLNIKSPTVSEEPHFKHEKSKVDVSVFIGAFAYIGNGASINSDTRIGANAYIGEDVVIGKNCNIFPGVKIYPRCVIGDNCIIHAGTVIGSDGFGFAPKEDNYMKVPQVGNVVIGNHVEIGANCTIDRATLGSTIIEDGVKLDNLIQIAHNVVIGKNTVIASQTGVSGSTKLGANMMIAGQVGIIGHIEIADGVKIGAQSGIGKTIKEKNSLWFGSPAFDYKNCLKSNIIFQKLPELKQDIETIKSKLK